MKPSTHISILATASAAAVWSFVRYAGEIVAC